MIRLKLGTMAESKNNIKTIISEVNEATKEIRKQLLQLESGDVDGDVDSFDRTFSERSKLYFTIQKVQFEALVNFLDKGIICVTTNLFSNASTLLTALVKILVVDGDNEIATAGYQCFLANFIVEMEILFQS
jgi:hypothetical protein